MPLILFQALQAGFMMSHITPGLAKISFSALCICNNNSRSKKKPSFFGHVSAPVFVNSPPLDTHYNCMLGQKKGPSSRCSKSNLFAMRVLISRCCCCCCCKIWWNTSHEVDKSQRRLKVFIHFCRPSLGHGTDERGQRIFPAISFSREPYSTRFFCLSTTIIFWASVAQNRRHAHFNADKNWR